MQVALRWIDLSGNEDAAIQTSPAAFAVAANRHNPRKNMFPMWNDTDEKSEQTTARLRDLEARMDAYLLQKRGRSKCELVRAVADAREKVREAIRPKKSMAR